MALMWNCTCAGINIAIFCVCKSGKKERFTQPEHDDIENTEALRINEESPIIADKKEN